MIPSPIRPDAPADVICALAERWMIAPTLAFKLHVMAGIFEHRFSIISGHRTAEQQELERKAGRPTAPDELSTHLSCPATGADLRLEVEATVPVKLAFGRAAMAAGLRWGGGSSINVDGVPSDWNHVDLGRRKQ